MDVSQRVQPASAGAFVHIVEAEGRGTTAEAEAEAEGMSSGGAAGGGPRSSFLQATRINKTIQRMARF